MSRQSLFAGLAARGWVPVTAALIIGGALVTASGLGRSHPVDAAPRRLAGARPLPPERPALRAGWRAGINLTANTAGDYLDPGSDAALKAARQDRSTSVEIVPTWYMAAAGSSSVAADPARSPSDAAVVHAAATARALGLQVLLKPQVDVLDGTYRGRIRPVDRQAWQLSYRAMLLHYADLSRQLGLGGLVVGVELGSMVDQPGDAAWWRGLIKSVRDLGFSGSLTYATNWDQLQAVGFWRALDYIGIDAYFPLIPPGRPYSPTTEQLMAAWHGSYVGSVRHDWVSDITRLQRAQRRPVVFTELGYGPTTCSAVAPYQLEPRCADARAVNKPSQRAQQNAYVAALRVWSRIPFLAGIYWWDWPTDANRAGDAYSPRGKLAEQSIARWNGARGTLR